MRTERIKQHTIFAFNYKATQWRITRTVGETVYYRRAKVPFYLYNNTALYTTTKAELASSAYEIVQAAR